MNVNACRPGLATTSPSSRFILCGPAAGHLCLSTIFSFYGCCACGLQGGRLGACRLIGTSTAPAILTCQPLYNSHARLQKSGPSQCNQCEAGFILSLPLPSYSILTSLFSLFEVAHIRGESHTHMQAPRRRVGSAAEPALQRAFEMSYFHTPF